MKKKTGILLIAVLLFVNVKGHAQLSIAEIIKQAVTKVIVALDLKIQRLQNKTIWLQNAQKKLENEMSRLKLAEIRDWAEKQRKLYDDYFHELWQVKTAISSYSRIKELIQKELAIVKEYKEAWNLFRTDQNFSPGELDAMATVYTGMMEKSLQVLDDLSLVVNAFTTQMTDGKRLQLVNAIAERMDKVYSDLKSFNEQNKTIAIQRGAEKGEIETVRRLYGF